MVLETKNFRFIEWKFEEGEDRSPFLGKYEWHGNTEMRIDHA